MGGSGQLKKYVTESVNDFLAPIRERRVELMGDMDYVKDVLREGNRRANEIANQTLEEVREAMGMVYYPIVFASCALLGCLRSVYSEATISAANQFLRSGGDVLRRRPRGLAGALCASFVLSVPYDSPSPST